ncbi:NADH dehydrogenase [ubiquinone] 1 beta subcomplex subunit 1-like [Thalassophryne amazonica]|uniref:NADH dehydrogenase [ubiquinone] 1 beta subcomplex subunit 1-like n=1 Tax=Thalassophryne amazonica TaxID=390379 RepID=UPI001471B8A0|nr:NADH dehydrogenase [ubiquinone] 1 beta subcomplex subunit 1-like [Thalassophryne amazonica]
MVSFVTFFRDHWMHSLMPIGFLLGWYLDRQQDEKLSGFRNKSQLFKRELKPGEEVTWK